MRVIQLTAGAGADGRLRLDVPDADADTEYDVVLTAKVSADRKPIPEELGWPKGYFESTFGRVTDDTFVRPPQLPLEPVESVDES